MTKPTLPPLPAKATAHLQRVNKARNEMKMATDKLLVKRQSHAMNQDLIVMGFTPSTLAKIGKACTQYSQFQSLTGAPVDIEVRKFAKDAETILKGEGV